MKKSEFVAEIQLKYVASDISKREFSKIRSSCDAHKFLRIHYNPDTIMLYESFVVLYLNRSSNIIGYQLHSIGGIASTLVEVQLIVATALICACKNVIISHNHPSGSMKPSTEDIRLTTQVEQALKFFNITLLDHLILSPEPDVYCSFTDEGYL